MADADPAVARWDMKLPFSVVVIALLAAIGSYYGQKEATSVALTELKGGMLAVTGELAGVKASITRIETDRYTGADARRDASWRDERAVDLGRRVAQLELDMRRKR